MEKNNGQNDKYSHDHRNVEETSNDCKKGKQDSNTAGAVLYRKRLEIRECSPTYVYMHLNRKQDILYIGITNNLSAREHQHRRDSCWFRHVFHIKTIKFKNLRAAAFAEERLIKKHRPPYNNDYLPCPKNKRHSIYPYTVKFGLTYEDYYLLCGMAKGNQSFDDVARDIFESSLEIERELKKY